MDSENTVGLHLLRGDLVDLYVYQDLHAQSMDVLLHAKVRSSLGFVFDADPMSRQNMRDLLTIADYENSDSIRFRDSDNKFHNLSREDLKCLLYEACKNSQYLCEQRWNYKQQLDTAVSNVERYRIRDMVTFKNLSF